MSIEWRIRKLRLVSADKDIVYHQGTIYCIADDDGSTDAHFYAIDACSGKIQWTIDLAVQGLEHDIETFSSPVVKGNFAYFLRQPNRPWTQPVLYGVDIVAEKLAFEAGIYTALGKKYKDGTVHEYRRLVRTSILIV